MKKVNFRHIAITIVLVLIFRYCSGYPSNEAICRDRNADDTNAPSLITPDYVYSNGNTNLSYRLIDLVDRDRSADNNANNGSGYSSNNTSYGNTNNDVYSQMNYAVENLLPSVTVFSSEDWAWIDFQGLEYGAANLLEYTYRHNSDGSTTYYFTYNVNSINEYCNMKNELLNIAQAATASIYPSMSCVEKSRIIVDYITCHCVYDYGFTNPNSHNLWGVLHDGVGICSARASAFKFLMNFVGEEVAIVSSNTHAFCQVSTNPNLYIDPTWSDIDMIFSNGQEYISYSYFAITDSDLSAIEDHLIIDRTQDVVGSHPEYTWNDSIATTSFSDYDISRITQYCLEAYQSGYMNMTLDFDTVESYQAALNNLPYDLYGIEQSLNAQQPLYYSSNDDLMNMEIYVGEWYSLVENR